MMNMMNTSKVVIALGSIVSGVGKKLGGKLGAGLVGFGLAHIVLGMLDKARSPWR
ncbi:hypothetical protein V2B37_08610 [Natranaerobius thermophilus JW/NM-WN-LF]|uniref:Uncharacterized protein n=2 Tax=Natranaerobius TaxID=375928 RepID=B2A4L5_NATTJ|nr:hypothetical protein Nther_1616 [Natranaerobius thermophilus JW/NM-WN-LF]